jgi:hypothetical protein
MRTIEPARWEDLALAVLLIITGLPQVLYALLYDQPVGAAGTLSMVSVALALLILIRRHTSPRNNAPRL